MDASFSHRFQQIINEFKSLNDFAKKCGIRESSLRPYLHGAKPGLDALITVAKTANINIEWLATGVGPMRNDLNAEKTQTVEPAALFNKDSNQHDLAEGLKLLGKIYSSGDQILIRAINANLKAFGDAIDDRERANNAISSMGEMEKRIAALERKLEEKDDPDSLEDQRAEGAG